MPEKDPNYYRENDDTVSWNWGTPVSDKPNGTADDRTSSDRKSSQQE
jgi:hypothetical protein